MTFLRLFGVFFNNVVETYIEKLWILLKQEDFCPYDMTTFSPSGSLRPAVQERCLGTAQLFLCQDLGWVV